MIYFYICLKKNMKIPSYLFHGKFIGVYCIENVTNKKRYVGSSNNIYSRLHKHNSILNKGCHENCILQNSWSKHGDEKFECYVLEFCEESNLTKIEQKWIDLLNPEYNITRLVERNVLSQESRNKTSSTLKDGYATGKIKFTNTRSVNAYDLKGNLIGEYDTIKQCSKELDIHASSIERVLSKVYSQCRGYVFRYPEDTSEFKSIERSKYLTFSQESNVKRNSSVDIYDINDNFIETLQSRSDVAKKYNVSKASVCNIINLKYENCKNRKKIFYKFKLHAPVKSDKLLGNPEEDNQQPIISLND